MIQRLPHIVALLLLFTIVGCSSDPKVTDSLKGVRISTSIATDATRVDLDGSLLTWQDDECIYIYRTESGDMYSNNIGELHIDPSSISEDRKNAEFYSSSLTLQTGVQYIAVTRSSNIVASDYVAFELNSDPDGYYSPQQIEDDLLLGSQLFELQYIYDIPTLYFNIEESIIELDIKFISGNEFNITSLSVEADNSCFAHYVRLNRDGSFGIKDGEERDQTDSSVTTYLDGATIGGEYYKVSIPVRWCETVDAVGDFTISLATDNGEYSSIELPAKVLEVGTIYYRAIDMDDPIAIVDSESTILMKLYDAYDGASWSDCNWSLDLPIEEWTRVELDATNQVSSVDLSETPISGDIPIDILSQLTSLKKISLAQTEVSGTIPDALYAMTSLTHLDLSGCQLTGTLSAEITNLTKLQQLSLNNNYLSGAIPFGLLSIMSNCSDGASLLFNNFTSEGNETLYINQSLWNLCAPFILAQNSGYGFGSDFSDCVYIDDVDLTLSSGYTISSEEYFAEHEYTCIVAYDSNSEDHTLSDMAQQLYTTFESVGMGLLTICDTSHSLLGMEVVKIDGGVLDKLDLSHNHIVVDREGKVVSSPYVTDTDQLSLSEGDSSTLLFNFINDALKDYLLYILLETTTLEVSPEGGEYTISILSNTLWDVSTTASWITLSKSVGYNNEDYIIKCSVNNDTPRVGTITFTTSTSTVTLTVSQSRDTLSDFTESSL